MRIPGTNDWATILSTKLSSVRSAPLRNYLNPWQPTSHCGCIFPISNHDNTLHRHRRLQEGAQPGR